jgi:hypothetical protein
MLNPQERALLDEVLFDTELFRLAAKVESSVSLCNFLPSFFSAPTG